MVAIFLPNGIDLNKYFEDMNNRCLQLETHHIVKTDLLSTLSGEQPLIAYAAIWDAISQMNWYLEYSLWRENKENRRILANRETAFNKVIHNY